MNQQTPKQQMARIVVAYDDDRIELSDWEISFLDSIDGKEDDLTPKQQEKLYDIFVKVKSKKER